jgi:hypothetical protein
MSSFEEGRQRENTYVLRPCVSIMEFSKLNIADGPSGTCKTVLLYIKLEELLNTRV